MTYDPNDDLGKSIELCLAAIRKRIANGGPPWVPGEKTRDLDVEFDMLIAEFDMATHGLFAPRNRERDN